MKKQSLKEDLEILEDMLTGLVDLLEEKGIITNEEWNEKIKKRIKDKKNLIKFENL